MRSTQTTTDMDTRFSKQIRITNTPGLAAQYPMHGSIDRSMSKVRFFKLVSTIARNVSHNIRHKYDLNFFTSVRQRNFVGLIHLQLVLCWFN